MDTFVPVSCPDGHRITIAGVRSAHLGHRPDTEPTGPATAPNGEPIYWVGPAGAEADAGPGTDFDAVKRGFVSVTPLHVDLTRYAALEQVSSWLSRG